MIQLDGTCILVGDPGPDGDDHADHGRDRHRRAALGPAHLDRGRRGARRQPLPGAADGRAADRPGRRSSPPRCSPRRGPWARRSCSRWSRARSASRPTRSTASPSSSSRPAPLAATIVDNADGPLGQAVRADDLRLRGDPARLQRLPLLRRLGGPPARCANTRWRPMSAHGTTARPRRSPRSRRAPTAPRRRGAAATGSASRWPGRRASCSA